MYDRDGMPVGEPRLPGLTREAAQYLPLAGPMILSRLGLAGMGLIDGLMLAQHSMRQLALHGLAEGIATRLLEVGMAFTMAGIGLAAQAHGGSAAERMGLGPVWRQSLWLAVIAGLLGCLLCLGSPWLLGGVGQAEWLALGAGRVLAILGLGMLPALAAMASASVLEAQGRGTGVAVAVVVANLLNIVLNAWLMGGPFHGLPTAAEAVAWSTLVVRVLLALALAAAVWFTPHAQAYGLRRRFGASAWNAGAEQRAMGLAAAAPAGLLAVLGLCVPLLAGWLGELAMASMAALLVVLSPVMVLGWGLADAAGLRVAGTLAQSQAKPGAVRRVGLRCATLAAAVLLLAALVFNAAPALLASAVVKDAALAESVGQLVPLGLMVVLLESMALLFANAMRSLGELRWNLVAQLASALLVLPLAAQLAFGWEAGLLGLLCAQALVAGLRALALALLFRHCATHQDAAAVRAARARAAAIANGWADTVLLWPAASAAGQARASRLPQGAASDLRRPVLPAAARR